MGELHFVVVDEASLDDIPAPARPGARCQTCHYWERLDGGRAAPGQDARDAESRASLKRQRLLAARAISGSNGIIAYSSDSVDAVALGWSQFGPLSHYPRAQSIRDRYPELPESPAPWVVTCLQIAAAAGDADARERAGADLLEAVCAELDRRGITAVEAYPEDVGDAWDPSPGPASVYEGAGFERVAGDERYPVYRRELAGETDADAWSGLLEAARLPDDDEGWPLPLPKSADADDFFRLPPEKPRRPNPFGDD